MKQNNSIGRYLLILIACFTFRVCGSETIDLSSSFLMPGLSFNHSTRMRFRKYENMNEREQLDSRTLVTGALHLGRRYPVSENFRFQLSGSFQFGMSAEDTLHNALVMDGDTISILRRRNFTSGAVSPELQYCFPPNDVGVLFLIAGVNLNYSSIDESESDLGRTVRFNNSTLVSDKTTSLGYTIGAGLEFPVTARAGLAFIYNFKHWRPVRFTETRDLFPMGAEYRETFFTHSIQLHLLLPSPVPR